jgi:hypothetical protein
VADDLVVVIDGDAVAPRRRDAEAIDGGAEEAVGMNAVIGER